MQAQSVHDSLLQKSLATLQLTPFRFYLINDKTAPYDVGNTVKFLHKVYIFFFFTSIFSYILNLIHMVFLH